MIILDTNQLLGIRVTGALGGMLRALAEDKGLKLAISSVTRDEYRSRRLREADEAIGRARTSHETLRSMATHWRPGNIEYPSAEAIIASVMEEIETVFEIVDLDGNVAVEALRREVYRKRPASTDKDLKKKGSGARDAAIWLTAVDQSKRQQHPVYMVSADVKAFGGATLDPVLAAEAHAEGAEIVLCEGIPSLLGRLARRVEVDADLPTMLSDQVVIDAVREAIGTVSFISIAIELGARVPSKGPFTSGGVQRLSLVEHGDAHAYDVRGSKWVTVSAIWKGGREMEYIGIGAESTSTWTVEFQQEVTLLVKTLKGGVQSAVISGWQYPNIRTLNQLAPSD